MREIVSVNLGQAGVQTGSSILELLCQEHGIQLNGAYVLPDQYSNLPNQSGLEFISSFFNEDLSSSKFTPRSLFIDLDPTTIDQIRQGPFSNLIPSKQLISGQEDAASNFARGYRTGGENLHNTIFDRLRKLVEKCDAFQGFIITNAIGGGTGSGLGSLLLESLQNEYHKEIKLGINILPSPQISPVILEPYNTVLGFQSLIQHLTMSVLVENQQLYDICEKQLDIERPLYEDINKLIALAQSCITAGMRFGSDSNSSLRAIASSFIPYPRIHFTVPVYAPLIPRHKAYHEPMTIKKITKSVFRPQNQFAQFGARDGKYLTNAIFYRGDVGIQSFRQELQIQLNSLKYVNYCSREYHTIITRQPTVNIQNWDVYQGNRNVCRLVNHTGIKEIFSSILSKYDLLKKHKSFMWRYMEEGQDEYLFEDCEYLLKNLVQDYKEVEVDTFQRPMEDSDEDD